MKKIFALILSFVFIFSGCVSTEPQIDPNIVLVEINSCDGKNIDYTVVNNSKDTIELGNDYRLEYKEGNNWVEVPETGEVFFSMIAYVLNPGEGKSFSENLEMRYGELQKGTYRIVKSVRLLNEDGEICGAQQATGEFEIN